MMTTDLSNTPKRRTYLRNALWYGGFWLLLTLWLRLCLPESLMGLERHQLFRFSADYFRYFSSTPYPVLLYLQAFFTQFYLYPLLGAAVMSGLLVLGMGAWRRLTGRYWTGLVWVAAMLPLLPYFNLLWVLFWLVVLSGGLLVNLRRLSSLGRLVVTAGLALAGTFVLQENVVFALVFWSLIGGLRTHSWRNGLYGLAAGLAGGGLGIGLIVWIGYPLFYTQYFSEWSLLKKDLFFFSDFPAMFFNRPALIHTGLYIGLALCMVLPFASLLPQAKRTSIFDFKKFTIRQSLLTNGLCSLMLCGVMVLACTINLRYQMEDFYLVDRLAGEGRWTQAADAAELSFYQRSKPEAVSLNRTDHLRAQRKHAQTLAGRIGIQPAIFQNSLEEGFMAEMLKVCLLADRQASNSLFTYSGSLYFPLLFPEDNLYSASSYLVALYYTQKGLYAEALHMLYDFITAGRISTAVLEPVLWNSVVVGDYEPCRKFIRFFEQSLFHKDIARRYTTYITDTVQTALKPEIAAARTLLSTHNHTVLAYNPDNNIYFRSLYESDNAAVYEYALTLWMVYKNHNRILAELPKIRQYYQTLPIHIQEAILACFTTERLDEVPEDIDPWIKARYNAFLQTLGLYQNGYTSFQKLKKGFEDTYWYHLHFNDFKPISEIRPIDNGGKI